MLCLLILACVLPKDASIEVSLPGTDDTDTDIDADTDSDTDADTDSDSDADTDADTDTDSDTDSGTTVDECAEAATLCGQELTTIDRSVWGASFITQNASLTDWTNSDNVITELLAGYYPPIPSWPDVSDYPESYDVGDELNSGYGWAWYENTLDWPATEHVPTAVTIHHTNLTTTDCDAFMVNWANDDIFGSYTGYGDIGLQMLVCEDSAGLHVYEGRMCTFTGPFSSMWCVGAHTLGYNTGNVGIALVGDFDRAAPNATEFEALAEVTARVMYEVGITDISVIKGHRDYVSSMSCPGDELYRKIPELQERVEYCKTCGY